MHTVTQAAKVAKIRRSARRNSAAERAPLLLAGDGLLRLPEVLAVYPVCASTWYAGVRSGIFPAGVRHARYSLHRLACKKYPRPDRTRRLRQGGRVIALPVADRLDLLRALYGSPMPKPDHAEALRRQLAEAPDYFGATLADAANRPTPERMERVIRDASGIAAIAGRLRAALLRGGGAGERS